MKRFAQITAVAGALLMLVGFVVYSQQRAVQADDYIKIAPAGTSTNTVTRPEPTPAVAPGSKSQAPLIQRPATATSTVGATPAPPAGFTIRAAPSSKSGVVISPEQLSVKAPEPVLPIPPAFSNPPAQYFALTGQVLMLSTKSAPVIAPATFANQRAVALATNPPQRTLAR